MDQIPQAAGSPHEAVQVPYVVTKRFEDIIFDHENITAEWEGDDLSEPRLFVTFVDGKSEATLVGIRDVLNFYQARCFFGLLSDMYSVAEQQLHLETYLDDHDDKQIFVTTRFLIHELNLMTSLAGSCTDESKIQKYLKLDEFIQETENLTVLLQTYTIEISQLICQEAIPQQFLDLQLITESTAMLRETLLSAGRQMFLPSVIPTELASTFGRELPPAPENIFCMERFKTAGWCPRQAFEIAETSIKSRSVLFALSSIDRRKGKDLDHSSCKEVKCVFDSIDNDTYQTLDAPTCDAGNCPLVPVQSNNKRHSASWIISKSVLRKLIPTISIIERSGSQPLLRIRSYQALGTRSSHDLRKRQRHGSSSCEFSQAWYSETRVKLLDPVSDQKHAATKDNDEEDRDHDETNGFTFSSSPLLLNHLASSSTSNSQPISLPFIAISHVWSQGLGNRHLNALPICQLRRLQRLANSLVPPSCRPVPFWIDTICVPLQHTARQVAIKSMRKVYRDAMATLVVDSTLTKVDFDLAEGGTEGDSKRLEMLMRIKAAPWSQRLWTYHEACLAQQMYFQFGAEEKPATWSQDIVIVGLANRANVGVNQDEKQGEIEQQREYSDDGDSAGAETPGLQVGIASVEASSPSRLPHNHKMPLEFTANYLLSEAASLQLFGNHTPSAGNPITFHSDLRYLSRQLALRTTSRLQDEAICMSALLGLDPAAVMVDASGVVVGETERVRRLWDLLAAENIPVEVLFCNRPFYGDQGAGWMAKSLLRDDLGNWINHLGCGQVLRKDEENGILVEMGGVLFEIPGEDDEEKGNQGQVGQMNASSLYSIMLGITGINYKIVGVDASEPIPTWRSSVHTGKFAILMPPSEVRALLEEVDERVQGSRSHSAELPFGVLVNLLGNSRGDASRADVLDIAPVETPIHAARREMVEFELQSENESADALRDDTILVEAQLVPVTQRWWVG